MEIEVENVKFSVGKSNLRFPWWSYAFFSLAALVMFGGIFIKGYQMSEARISSHGADIKLAPIERSPQVSSGMALEVSAPKRIPIIIVMEQGNVHDHAFVREVAGYVAQSVMRVSISRSRS